MEKILFKFSSVFPGREIGPDGIQTYLEMLYDLDDKVLIEAAKKCLTSCRFFPTIAEIRNSVPEGCKKIERQIEENLFWLERGQLNPHATDKQIETGISNKMLE
jgi:hypothetical protein